MTDSAAVSGLRAFESSGQSSPMASIDARVKIVAAVAWSVLLAALSSIPAALVALAGSLGLIVLARWPWRNLGQRLLTVNFFILFMWLMLPFSFSSPGQVVAAIGPLDMTREGLELATLLTVQANAILIAVIALLATSPLFVLAAAGRKIHFPEKLVNLFLLSIRYFHVMHQEFSRLRNAMRMRGFKADLSRNTLHGVANLASSLLIRSFDRADRVHRAMLCRGYTGVIWVKNDFIITKKDIAFSVLMLGMLIAAGGCEWLLIG